MIKKIEAILREAIEYKKQGRIDEAKKKFIEALELSKSMLKNATKAEAASIGKLTDYIATEIKGLKTPIRRANKKMSFADIIGHMEAKEEITQNLIEPALNPEINTKFYIETSKGMLMYGPPGTGKTTFAKAVAGEIDAKFIHVQSNDILDKYVGESERKLNEIFTEADKERTIILFDEFDQIASTETTSDVSKRLIAQLKELIDGFSSSTNVYVLAATNYPDKIEFGLRRRLIPIYLGLPDLSEIQSLLELKLRKLPKADDLHIPGFVSLLSGYSGSDIDRIVQLASKAAARREREMKKKDPSYTTEITNQDVIDAIKVTPRSVSSRDLQIYERYREMMSR